MTHPDAPPGLLAVDLGVRTGLARYGADGRLVWYRSQNFGARARLKSAIPRLLREAGPLDTLVLEGGGDLHALWTKAAEAADVRVLTVQADAWRDALMIPRAQRTGADAKAHADTLARQVIAWSGAPRPTSLRHDVAEAILAGLWGVLERGWVASARAVFGQARA